MPQPVHVCFLPSELNPEALPGSIAIVVDVLRASSTITTALRNHAACVVPCETTDQALAAADRVGRTQCILGGERGGVRISGFDLGNSPAEYTVERIAGRRVIFTTTNGTHALMQCQEADEILVGSFVNLSALAARLAESGRPVHVVCAGTDGCVTGEDVLFAGALLTELTRRTAATGACELSDAAAIALSHWRRVVLDTDIDVFDSRVRAADLAPVVASAMRFTNGGRNLLQLGYDNDLTLCAQIDATDLVPRFHVAAGEIR